MIYKNTKMEIVLFYLMCLSFIRGESIGFRTFPEASCSETDFRCADGSMCIPKDSHCDLIPDCPDASDEAGDCPALPCMESFTCKASGRCIHHGWLCDGDLDCGPEDTSDEDPTICGSTNPCAPNHFSCQDGVSCRHTSLLCNGKDDCPDGDDEGEFCGNSTICSEMSCEHGCQPTKAGGLCYCPEGKMNYETHCVDFNKCNWDGTCDQRCSNRDQVYSCSCVEGYELQENHRCEALDEPDGQFPRLLYGSTGGLGELYLNGTAVPGNISLFVGNFTAFDFDHKNGIVWWLTRTMNESRLNAAPVGNLSQSWSVDYLHPSFFDQIHYIARDWVTGNWYLLDSREVIFICNATFTVCTILIDNILSEPRGIALDPSTGYLFFGGGGGRLLPKLERALMDGTERKVIVTRKIAFGITLDYPNRHVYSIDFYMNSIERVDYDGNNRRTIARLPTDERPMGITLFENYLYVTNPRNNSILRISRFHFNEPDETVLAQDSEFEYYFVQVYHRQRQPKMSHPCGVNNGNCSHLCLPLWHNDEPVARCKCQAGFVMQEPGVCVAETDPTLLIYAKGRPGMIKGLQLAPPNFSSAMSPVMSLSRPTVIDFDARAGYIYYADIQRFVIERRQLIGGDPEVVTTGIFDAEGLAVDWMGRNLYWTDKAVQLIFMCSLENPDKRRIVVNESLEDVRDIVLDPGSGVMFWTFWNVGAQPGKKKGLIETAWMDGTHRRTFIEEDHLWANGLTLDYDRKQLYWCDGYNLKIERINMDGSGREVLLHGEPLVYPYSLSLFDGFLYWSEHRDGNITRINLDDLSQVQNIHHENPYLFDLKVYNKERQKGSNGCENLNCEDFCLATPTGPRCDCRIGFQPHPENTTACVPILNFTQPRECDVNEFLCNVSLFCVQKYYLCDGEDDCHDMSDEDNSAGGLCKPIECREDMFRCGDNKCISSLWQCDGDLDCEDGSDELEINCECAQGLFKCMTGRCISQTWVCDSEADCGPGDSSDEHENCEYEKCEPDYFTCGDMSCLSIIFVCDNEPDCQDGTDEMFCGDFCNHFDGPRHYMSPFCTSNCANITDAEKCKTMDACHLCRANETADAAVCIPSIQVCDHNLDCPSGTDEENCPIPTSIECHGAFLCSNPSQLPECIPELLRCDGNFDCMDHSDEEGCEEVECSDKMWRCVDTRECIHDFFRCDGEMDCHDGSDEEDCPPEALPCLKPRFLCDNGTKCIPPDSICDNYVHCKDGTDEGGRCGAHDCTLIVCESSCKQGPEGPFCVCPNGQTLNDDGLSCSQMHHCDIWGICSQVCVPLHHSYKCTCLDGFQIEMDRYTCKSIDSAIPYLLFSNRYELRRLGLRSNSSHDKALLSSLKNTIALDFLFSPAGDYLFWTDVVDDKIYKGLMAAGALTNIEVVVETGLATAEGLAVDWVGHNLYWVESKLDQIEVAKLNGSFRRTLISTHMESPRAISLDPRVGMLFWTDWEDQNARIESASMSGEGRRVVVLVNEIEGGGWPNGITLDYTLKRIYWIDAKSDSIHTAFYDGSDSRKIIRSHQRLSHAFAISLFENNVYWTDWRTNSVVSANKFNGSNIQVLQKTMTQPFDIQIFHPSRQPKVSENPCLDNGGCSHLCLLSFNGTRQCNCPQIMSISSDNITCIRQEKVLIFSRANEIRGVDISKPSSDIITRIPIAKSQTILPIDFVESNRLIYWTDVKMNEIRRINMTLPGASPETVVDTAIENPRGFAIDWLSRNMFIASSGLHRKHISVATINGEFLMPIISNDIFKIESLAVDPYEGRIFWSDVGGLTHTIQIASMLGTDRRVLTSQKDNHDLKYPTSLTYDPQSKRLYWSNQGSKTIQYYDFAIDKVLSLLVGDNTSEPMAITVYKEFIYFFDGVQSNIYRMDKFTGSGRMKVQTGIGGILSMKVYDKNLRLGSSNACSQNHSRCAHLCLPINATERQCRCAVGYRVEEKDPSVCIGESDVLIYSTPIRLSGLSVANIQSLPPLPTSPSGISEVASNQKNSLPPISQVGIASRLDFHAAKDLLVWVDEGAGTITRIQRDGTGRKILLKGSEDISGIAVDWVANNVYWSNSHTKVIELCRLSGSERFVVIADGLNKPGAIALHPQKGYMFWADTGLNPRIERATLDGKNRTVIANTSLQYIGDLALDYEKEFLYFIDVDRERLEKMALDGSSRSTVLSLATKPSSLFVFRDHIYLALSNGTGSHLEMVSKKAVKRKTLQLTPHPIKSLIVMSDDVQRGTNPCALDNGACREICMFNGTSVNCHCFHGRIGKDRKTCHGYDAFLMYSNNTSIQSLHMFDDRNPNAPLKPITSDFMKNAISLAFDYSRQRLYYSDIQRKSINSVFFNGSDHIVLVEGEGSVEGVAFEEKQRDLYWTCQNDSSINRISVEPRQNHIQLIVQLNPDDKPRGIAVDGCELRIYWTNWNPKAPSIQRSYLSGLSMTSIITTEIRMPNGLVIDHKAQNIYWADARLDKIERCNMDGTSRVVLIAEYPNHPFDLAIYKDFLFWTDWGLKAVFRANKYTGEEITKLTPRISNLMGIIAVANDTNACETSPCRIMNGGCEDFCQTDERAQVICSCSSGRMLLPDGRRCSSNASRCSKDEFACGSGFCIPYSFSCDGRHECPDDSDEDPNYCSTRVCREGYFSCSKGLCVSQTTVCDGVINCPGFEDETNCQCKPDQFRCTESGLCISASHRCNFKPDCPDATDEMDCPKTDCSTLLRDSYKGVDLINCVHTTNCIHPKWICDGYNDCWDNSDEQNCNTTSTSSGCKGTHYQCTDEVCEPTVLICDNATDHHITTNISTTEAEEDFECQEVQFKCASDGKCIYNHWKCDGMNDCKDGSDEPEDCMTLPCAATEFKCNETGRCIPSTWVCDGDIDCGKGASDENPTGGCPVSPGDRRTQVIGACKEGQFMCPMFHRAEFECISMTFYCDGIEDCTDGSDEPDSCQKRKCHESQYECANRQCIPAVWVCNGRHDCKDGSDETNCAGDRTRPALGTAGCEDSHFRCANSICVELKKLCDGHDDCGDYSDERQCDVNECLSTNPRVCAHTCIDKPIGYSCQCHPGFEINPEDSKLCQDIDECQTEFPCSHICTNTLGSYKCSCAEGYVSEDDSRTCKANSTVKPHLIVSIRFFIREIGLGDDTFNRFVIKNLTNVVALDFEWESNCFFWSDVTHLSSSIKRICRNEQPEVLHTTVQSPDGIAVDWVGKNLYWCDKGKDTIEVSKIDGNYRKVLIHEGLEDPRAIVLDPFHGYMYWTDWGNQPHIGKAGMDGTDQTVLINSTVGWPNALTISYATNEIFWADAHYDYIGRCDLDGNNRKVILDKDTAPNYVRHIFAITVFEDWLYWTDWELKSIVRANKYTGRNINKLYSVMHRPMDLHVHHPYRQLPLKNNPCENGGGCDTMCLLAPGGNKTCACPQNYILEDDNKSCSSNCSSSQFVCDSTYKCIPFFWKCDTQDDCGDGSDEPPDCRFFNCTPGQFQCDNGNCIHPSQICDSKDQCDDGSDEKNCDEYTCMLSQFKCPAFNGSSAFCIPKKGHCDGWITDCPGGEDEQGCAPRTCSQDMFRCNNSQCIPLVWVCDEDKDCPDDSDEQDNCPSRECRENEFKCKNGRCIPDQWKCDGEYDCIEKEDEAECSGSHLCPPMFFQCANNKCIPKRWHCDGDDDCQDGTESDEVGCKLKPCLEDEYICNDGRCITKENWCDGILNCDDGSDEVKCPPKNCTEDQFMCVANGTCILREWVCDNDADCGDMSDEKDCHETCLEGQTQCQSGDCVPEPWICDGHADCRDGSDEDPESCAKHECLPELFKCNNSVCLPRNKLCNGFDDCGDRSDETNILCQRLCGPKEFECLGGRCISAEFVCDGFDDCTDNSDEESCPSGCRFAQCSQLCFVKKNGSHTCTCEKGYTLQSWSQKNQKSCFADGNLAYMILANDNHLRKLSPYKHGNSAGILTLTQEDAPRIRIESVDVLYGEKPQAFWTNRHEKTLVRMSVPTTDDFGSTRTGRTTRETNAGHIWTLIEGLDNPKGVAVDWVTKCVYFVDAGVPSISAITTDGKKRATIIGTGLEHPYDIAVDPASGQLFWADMGVQLHPRIEVARMNGSYRKTLVEGSLIWPVGLAIDYPARRLYWTDAKTYTIETVKLDGSDRNVVKKFGPSEEVPHKIDVFEDLLYVITLNTNTIYRMSKFGGRQQNMVKIAQYPLKLSDVVVVQEMKQDAEISNPCDNSSCGDALCLLSGPQTHSCVCPDGTRLEMKGDKVACIPLKSKKENCPLHCHLGRCIVTAKGPRCQCPPMYKGPRCNIYRCSGYCKNDGQCTLNPNQENAGGDPKLKCFCPPEWTGAQCETPLERCGTGFCANGGKCTTNNGTYTQFCQCPDHFRGVWCEQCQSVTCENGGTCRMHPTVANPFYCACTPFFYGSRCQLSKCHDICEHGDCTEKDGRLGCSCHPGWTGEKCNTCKNGSCTDPCSQLKCKNGGICQPRSGSSVAKCICNPGFFGNHCQYSYCNGFCLNGFCELTEVQPTCICNGGWTGSRCSVSTCGGDQCRPCSSLQCYNGGSCYTHLETKEKFCLCSKGFLGPTCNVSECENFCENGNCRNTSQGAVCDCEPGYGGQRCEEILSESTHCFSSPCRHGGTCVDVGDRVACKCPPKYGGLYCQDPINPTTNPCLSFSCLHGGVCLSILGNAVCVCPKEWVGSQCEKRPDCIKNPCFNGGTCASNPDKNLPPICKCTKEFVGMRCETKSLEISEKGAQTYEQSTVATITVAVLIAVLSVLGLIAALVIWRRRGKGIGHFRLHENGGTVEVTNPMYLHPTEPDEENEQVFTLHNTTNNFKNPIYDIMYDGAVDSTHEEKTELLQSDPLGVLDNHSTGGAINEAAAANVSKS